MGTEHRQSVDLSCGRTDLLYFEPDEETATAVIEGLDAELDRSVRSATVLDDALAELASSTPACVLCAYPETEKSEDDPIERIRERAPTIPIVAVVDELDERTVRAAVEAGADEAVERPSAAGEFVALAARIRRVGDGRPAREDHPRSSIVEAISDVVMAVDDAGTVRFANEATERVFGYDPDDLEGRSLDVLFTDEAVERYMEVVEGDRSEAGITLELWGRHREGREIPLGVTFGDWEGGVVGVLRDATERKHIEREVDEILGRVTDAFVALDEDARVTYLNERAAAVLQRSEEELLGADFWEEFSDAVGTTFYEAYEEIMETQRPVSFEEYYPPLDVWLEVNAYPSETGLSVYFRDVTERKRFERGLQSLHEATRGLLYTETKEDVCELVADVATEILDVPSVRMLLFDPEDNALRPVASDRDVPGADHDEHAWRAFIDGEPIVETSAGRDRLYLPLDDHAVLAIAGSGVDRPNSTVRRLVDLLAATAEAAFDRVEREEELRERDRALQERTESLRRLNEVTDTMRTIEGTLVQATTREGIEHAVCEKLLETERFVFAWIGSPDVDEGLVPRAWAGANRDYLDSLAEVDAENEPAYRATETGSVTEVSNVADAFRDEPWRKAALGRGYHSALAIPLVYEDVTYGVLAVYADRPDAFDELSHEVFAELGSSIAYAINAAETRRTLLSDTVVELDLRIRDPDDVLGRLADRIGAEVEFDDDVPQPDGTSLVRVTVRDGDADDPESALAAAEVGDLRVVDETSGGIRCELRTDEPTLATQLAEHGSRPQRVVVTPGEARAIVEAPGNTDVREFVERIRSTYPETELVARRDRDRPVRTRRELRTGFLESLTDRQEEVLRTAYLSGYFEWPRDSAGQEVAEALDIAQPTFHRHLRTGERKLLELLLEEGG